VAATPTALRLRTGRLTPPRVLDVLGVPVLAGLFGLAVGLGTLGREWNFPSHLLGHLDPFGTAAVGGLAAVLTNNLPAASLLSARTPVHPLSLLIGLDVGPNLFVSGSLAWVLWLNAARASGARPDIWRTVRIGLVAAPLSMAAAVVALQAAGHLR
jgi:arsenical pump membrane protein